MLAMAAVVTSAAGMGVEMAILDKDKVHLGRVSSLQ